MTERTRTVYAIRHNQTGKVYVGSTVHLESRIKDHIRALRRGAHPVPQMQDDFEKFGDDYSYFVLESELPDAPAGFKREHYWMGVLNSQDPLYGYNYKDRAKRPQLLEKFEEHKILPALLCENTQKGGGHGQDQNA